MAKNLKITQVKNVVGSPQTQQDIMGSLGLKKVHQSVVHPDNPAIRGQIHEVCHLVTVEKID